MRGGLSSTGTGLRATRTIRVFFAFDPRLSKVDKIYDAHIRRITKGGTANEKG